MDKSSSGISEDIQSFDKSSTLNRKTASSFKNSSQDRPAANLNRFSSMHMAGEAKQKTRQTEIEDLAQGSQSGELLTIAGGRPNKFNNSTLVSSHNVPIEESLAPGEISMEPGVISTTSLAGTSQLKGRVVRRRTNQSSQDQSIMTASNLQSTTNNASLRITDQNDEDYLSANELRRLKNKFVSQKAKQLKKDIKYGVRLGAELQTAMSKEHYGTLVCKLKQKQNKPEESTHEECERAACNFCAATKLRDHRIPIEKMKKLFINDFYDMKYQAETREMVGALSDSDEEREEKEAAKALQDYVDQIESREFISKKTFYLKYRTVYGASHEEAQQFI